MAVAIVRNLPVAPFSVVNLAAGASPVGFRDFLVRHDDRARPGIAMLTLVGDRLMDALRSPSPTNLALLAGALVGSGALGNRGLTISGIFVGRLPMADEHAAAGHLERARLRRFGRPLGSAAGGRRASARLEPDLVALQEVDARLVPRLGQPPARYAGRASRRRRSPGRPSAAPGSDYGNAVLSRLPIVEFSVTTSRDPAWSRGAPSTSGCVSTAAFVRFVAVHLGLRRRERIAQVQRLVAELQPLSRGGRHRRRCRRPQCVVAEGARGPHPRTRRRPVAGAADIPIERPLLRLDRIFVRSAERRRRLGSRQRCPHSCRIGSSAGVGRSRVEHRDKETPLNVLEDLMSIEWQQMVSNMVLMLIAFALALPIGMDRERSRRRFGLRTFPIVAMVSCGFMLVGLSVIDSTDGEARVMQGIITGIGFVGGGAILTRKNRSRAPHRPQASGTRARLAFQSHTHGSRSRSPWRCSIS